MIDRDQPIAVAVEGQPEIGAALDDRVGQGPGVGGAAIGVDVAPVRFGEQHRHVGAATAEQLGGDRTRRTVSAIEDQPQPVERYRELARRDDRCSGRRTSSRRPMTPTSLPLNVGGPSPLSSASILASTESGSLRPPAAKSLMPLSPNGLCDAVITAAGTSSS